MAVQKTYRHERGPEYDSPQAWKEFTDKTIKNLVEVMLTFGTGDSEKSLHGAATIGYDAATLICLGAAASLIQEALKSSSGNWLKPTEHTQARLPVARADERFQAFLSGMDSGDVSKKGGAA